MLSQTRSNSSQKLPVITKDSPDEALISSIKREDANSELAADYLFHRYKDQVRHTISSMVRDQSAVDDLVQDTFIKFFADPTRFDSSRNFSPWIRAVAANVARDHFRHMSRGNQRVLTGQGSVGMDEGLELMKVSEALSPSATVEATEERLREVTVVQEVLAKIPLPQRDVLQMSAIGIPYGIIAELTHTPIGTIKSRIHSARNLFRRLYEAATSPVAAA